MTSKLKVKKSLALENFVKGLVQKGICEVKELVDYESHKLNPQLVSDLMNFIEVQVEDSSYSKKDIQKNMIVKEILKACYDLSEEEIEQVDKIIQYALENGLVQKRSFFSSLGNGLVKGLRLAGKLLL